ncbi:FAD-dependent oxidoreductase [Mycolicibacterium sp. 3033]|nr:FAD-dependent oxidoreductase [Mycolicibacterium aurantiacum]
MAFVITQRCCNDASCVEVCPVDCIRPSPDHPDFSTTEMLYIDPGTCIDCGACVPACPVGAIRYEDDLPGPMERYREINAAYFERKPLVDANPTLVHQPHRRGSGRRARVAIVGSGPAACYAAEDLLSNLDVEVEMFDRLPTPHGLVRAGVAPDHAETKGIGAVFDSRFATDAVRLHLNVEVGKDVTHDELMSHHHAVIYAVGAFDERPLGIPGEQLPGSHPASEFVAWYNGHPDYVDSRFDLSGERAVIVGNGNVALDVARILLLDKDELAKTDIADHALNSLRQSNIREVVILGRRGPLQAAYSSSEFLALAYLPGVDVVIDPLEVTLDQTSQTLFRSAETDPAQTFKVTLAQDYADKSLHGHAKRVLFRYLVSPEEILGTERVTGVRIARNELLAADGELKATPTDSKEVVAASLVFRSVGFRGRAVAGLPFDKERTTVPHRKGRVLGGDGDDLTGVYVAGWIKRGATGTIGTNKHCSRETVESLVEDFIAGRLHDPEGDRQGLISLLNERQPELISTAGWRAIDTEERKKGRETGRPRVKFTDVDNMIEVARQDAEKP